MAALSLDYAAFRGRPAGLEYAAVPWDTASFGFPFYELRIDEAAPPSLEVARAALATLDGDDGSLISTKVDQQSVGLLHTLTQCQFYPVETMLDVEGDLKLAAALPFTPVVPVRLRDARQDDLCVMEDIARRAFWSDRFHLDPNLNPAAADERYALWVRRALSDGELVLAYERVEDGVVIGFYHLRPVSQDTVDLVLAAVDPALKGQGLGSALYRLAVRESVARGFSIAQTRIVARNTPVMNIFSRMGFRFQGARTSLHRFTPPGGRSIKAARGVPGA